MELGFLNELTESRLFRYRDDFRNKSARELADLLFGVTLLLEITRHRDRRVSREYAGRTVNRGEFDMVRPGSTDLANLISVLCDQTKFDAEINADSRISVPMLQTRRYLKDIADGKDSGNQDREYLLRLEDYLRVNDGELRNARRVISYWNSSSTTEKKNMLDQVARMVRTRANQLDLYTQIKHLL